MYATGGIAFHYAIENSSDTRSVAATVTANYAQATLDGLRTATTYSVWAVATTADGSTYASETATFTTPQPTATPALGKPWAELPAYDASVTEISHFITDAGRTSDGYAPRNYAMGYDKQKKAALWVAYPLHSFYTKGNSSERQYSADPSLGKTEQMVDGVSAPYNRGHQLPNADRRVSNMANKQISYYSNMTPQNSSFNGGAWEKLESSVRNNICSDTLYVVTGCHFDSGYTTTTDKGGYKCPVPTQYYKVLLRTKDGATGKRVADCPASELQCIGFWYEHTTSGSQTAASCAASVADIERKVGFTFFENVPDAPKTIYSTSDWNL